MRQAELDAPFTRHDLAALRRKALHAAAALQGDDPSGVESAMDELEHHRTRLAVECLYPDTMPFLSELRSMGVLIAAVTGECRARVRC